MGIISGQAIKGEAEEYLYAGLINVDVAGQNVAGLVSEVPSQQNGRLRFKDLGQGKRQVEMDLTLRPGLKWSDGAPLTTDDVAFAFEVGTAKGMPVPNPDFWSRVGLKVKDKQTFTLIFEPATFADLIGQPIPYAPAHVMRAEWEKTQAVAKPLDPQKDAEKLNEIYRNFFLQFASPQAINAGRMVYSGPFRVSRWVPGSTLELTRNPNYYLTPPGGADKYVQKVIYRFIQNTNSLLVSIMGGSIDATSIQTGLTFDQARSPQLVSRSRNAFDIWFVPSDTLERAEINNFGNVARVKELGLDDPRTRQAIAYALNREAWVKAFFDGLEPVAHTFINPVNPMSDPNVIKYPYDPAKSRQILSELGWKPGPDGILQRSINGKTVRFELEFVTVAGQTIRERSQQFFADNLKQVGIAVKINNAPSSVVFADDFIARASQGRWSGIFMYANTYSLANNAIEYTCKDLNTGVDNLATEKNNFVGGNIMGWCNAEFDKLRAQAVVEFDAKKRKALFDQMQAIWAGELPSIPLRFRTNPFISRKGLLNYTASTYTGGFSGPFGFASWQAYLIGWESRGAQRIYDQAKYAVSIK